MRSAHLLDDVVLSYLPVAPPIVADAHPNQLKLLTVSLVACRHKIQICGEWFLVA